MIEQKSRKFSTKAVIALVISMMCLTALLSWSVWSNPSMSFSTFIEEGSMVTESSFVIFKDGSTYYAKNGKTGAIDFSGTNCSEIVESAYNIDPGLIHFTSETFYFTSGIIVDDANVNFEGEGSDNTKLFLSDDADTSLFTINPGTLKNFVSIRSMTLWGNKSGQSGTSHGININGYTGDLFFTDLYIDDFLDDGIYIEPVTRVHNVWIQRNLIEGCDGNGITLNNTVGIHFVHIKDNYIFNNNHGIHVYDNNGRGLEIESNIIYQNGQHGILFEGVRYAGINNNQIFDNSNDAAYTYDGVYLGVHGSDHTYYVTINDNFICNQGFTNYQRYGIYIANLTDNLEIKDNYLVGNANASINIDASAATSSDIRGNLGFRTDFFGSSEASNDDWIAHNLAGIPAYVTGTVEETDARYILQIKARNVTHFQIYLYDETAGAAEAVDKTILWYAEFKPV